jgi:hypothetical protein
VPDISPLSLSFPLSSTVGGGLGTAGLTKIVLEVEGVSEGGVMCVLMSTRKHTNRLQYSVCKCEVKSTRKWSNVGVLFNQPHFNLVPKV